MLEQSSGVVAIDRGFSPLRVTGEPHPWVIGQHGHDAIRIDDPGRLSVRVVVGDIGDVIGGVGDAGYIAALA